jgi:hypothetical protein
VGIVSRRIPTYICIALMSCDAFRDLCQVNPAAWRAGADVVWPQFLAVFGMALLFLGLSLRRFRRITAASIT